MSRRRSRIALLAILALFVVPLALAWLMWRGTLQLEPTDTVNEGRLVIPPQPVAWTDAVQGLPPAGPPGLSGAWVALYPLPEPCEAACLERVRMLRQVHRAMGREAERIRIAVLAASGPADSLEGELRDIYPELHLLHSPAPEFVAALQRAGEGAADPSVYLVDPLGNVMMTYDAGDSMGKLRKDLKKLLKWSKVGQGRGQDGDQAWEPGA